VYTLISLHTWSGLGLAEYFDNKNVTARVPSFVVTLLGAVAPLRKPKISFGSVADLRGGYGG